MMDCQNLIQTTTAEIAVWNPIDKQFRSAPSMLEDSAKRKTGQTTVSLWLQWWQAAKNPAKLEEARSALLQNSRETQVLIPTTTWIAVEQALQAEILKRKKQVMDNHFGLTLDEQETPEPTGWLLLIAVLAYLWFRDRKRVQI